MAIDLIKVDTEEKLNEGLNSTNNNTKIKDEDLAFLTEEGKEKLRTQGKDFMFVPSGYESSNQLFLQSDGIKPVWKPYSPPKEYKWYGVQWPVDSKDPHLERSGNFEYHQTLPIQSQLKACIVKTSPTTKVKQYDLDPTDWNYRLNAPEIRAVGSVNYENKIGSGTIQISKTSLPDIPNFASAVNRLKDHYIKIADKFGTKQPFKITAVAEGAIDTNTPSWDITVYAKLESSGPFNSPFSCYLGSDRSGYDGQVLVDVPTFYIHSEKITVNNKEYNSVKISGENLGSEWTEVPSRYDTVYKVSILNEVPENMGYISTLPVNAAVSINNTSTYCRGNINRDDYDHYLTDVDNNGKSFFMRSDLGKHRTGISKTNMRKYCRLSGLEILSYYEYKSIYWMWVIEYANFNSQEKFNKNLTVGGLHQGGMGPGLTTMANGPQFNAYGPIVPNGFLDDLGSTTGVKDLYIPKFSIIAKEVNFNSVLSRYTHNYQATILDKVGIRNNVDYTVSDDTKTITITVVRVNGKAVGYNNSSAKGSATFHAFGLTGNRTIKVVVGSTAITFTAANQSTPQSIELNGYSIEVGGFATVNDAGGRVIVDPAEGGSTNFGLVCDSSSTANIDFDDQTLYPFRWRVYDNLFGDTWTHLDGIIIDASSQTGGDYNSVYTTRDPSLYCKANGSEHDRNTLSQLTLAGKELHLEGYITEYDLGTEGNIFPTKHEGSTGTGMCDFHSVGDANNTLRTVLMGGYSSINVYAGLSYFSSYFAPTRIDNIIGFRASCSK